MPNRFAKLAGIAAELKPLFTRLRRLAARPWRLKPVRILTRAGVVCILVISILLGFALDDTPQTVNWQGMTRDDIQRAKQLLHVTPEERAGVKTVKFNQKDLNIAASYILSHFIENTIDIRFLPDRLHFQMAIFAPPNPWGRYLDFHFALKQTDRGILLKSFKIGEISIPDPAANWLIPFIVQHSGLNRYWEILAYYVKEVRINQDNVEISYLGSVIDTAKQLLIEKHKTYPNLYKYQQQINDIVSVHNPGWRLSLTELTQPLFAAALEQSAEQDAIRENRSIIIALASYIYKNELRRYLPMGLVYNREYPVFAYKRTDVPEHFIASALITAVDNSLLSQQLGLDKEVGDAQRGTGFSFIDINSDRSGVRFGRLAIKSPAEARRLQQIMANTQDYSAIIPDITGLPEHMDEAAFKAQFQSVDSVAYRAMISEIDKRIDALPLYLEH